MMLIPLSLSVVVVLLAVLWISFLDESEVSEDGGLTSEFDANGSKFSEICNIKKVEFSSLESTFPNSLVPNLHDYPFIITKVPRSRQEILRRLTAQDTIVVTMDDVDVTLSSSNSYSERRRTTNLQTYIDEFTQQGIDEGANARESWYFFGETFTPPWVKLLDSYVLPPCVSCAKRDSAALSFGLGGIYSGVSWHNHGPGFSETIHGSKHWLMYDYADFPNGVPAFDPNQRTLDWIRNQGKNLTEAQRQKLMQCTVHEGEMIYFPEFWYHATLNLDNYTVFVSSFTTERDF